MNKQLVLMSFVFVLVVVYAVPSMSAQERKNKLMITSPSFKQEGVIPSEYTCQGADINPQLNIDHIPDGTKSLVIIVDDPDAPRGTWVHWVVYNIPVWGGETLIVPKNNVPGVQGVNDFRRSSYGGPCPPSGTHRYYFKIYAVDTSFQFAKPPTKTDLEGAIQGHIISSAELMGRYKKKR